MDIQVDNMDEKYITLTIHIKPNRYSKKKFKIVAPQ